MLQNIQYIINSTPILHPRKHCIDVFMQKLILLFQVRDGREKDTVKFSELHLRLQKSSIVKNRDAILTLLLHLAEKTNKYDH